MQYINLNNNRIGNEVKSMIDRFSKYRLAKGSSPNFNDMIEESGVKFKSYEEFGLFLASLMFGYEVKPQLYYVKFTDNKYSYLNISDDTGELYVYDSLCAKKGSRCKFTMDELLFYGKGYENYAIKAED